jgi:hypothetical protein
VSEAGGKAGSARPLVGKANRHACDKAQRVCRRVELDPASRLTARMKMAGQLANDAIKSTDGAHDWPLPPVADGRNGNQASDFHH